VAWSTGRKASSLSSEMVTSTAVAKVLMVVISRQLAHGRPQPQRDREAEMAGWQRVVGQVGLELGQQAGQLVVGVAGDLGAHALDHVPGPFGEVRDPRRHPPRVQREAVDVGVRAGQLGRGALGEDPVAVVGGDQGPAPVDDDGRVRPVRVEDVPQRRQDRRQGRVVERGLRVGGRVARRQQQAVALAERELERFGQPSPRIEALTMLAAIAPATSRVAIGTAALMPVLRRPVQAAQALASIDLLSGGRLTVAVGAGFPGPLGRPLYDLSEVPWAGRFARLDETVALWRQLWTGLEDFSRANYRIPLEQLETIQAVIAGPPAHVAAELGRYLAAGARHLVCRIAAPDLRSQREQLERIAGIFPLLRGGA